MNDVPAIFFEGVVFHFFFKKTMSAAQNLPGLFGLVASDASAKGCRHDMWLNNGQLTKESYVNFDNQLVDIDTRTPSRKHLHYTGIAIRADKEEYGTDPEAMERVLSATKGKHVLLSLRTPSISEEIAKCVDSIRVFDLKLHVKIASDVLKMTRSLVEKNTLNDLLIGEDVEVEDETAQLLVDLLKQKQFFRMYLHGNCSAALKTIIASWRENSEEMVGKMIYCKAGLSQLQRSLSEFKFKECTEEEERDAKVAYSYSVSWPCFTLKLVRRNDAGRAVYCRSIGAFQVASLFVFA